MLQEIALQTHVTSVVDLLAFDLGAGLQGGRTHPGDIEYPGDECCTIYEAKNYSGNS